MNKKELIKIVAEETGLTQGKAEEVLTAILQKTIEGVVQDNEMSFPGFGKFSTVDIPERQGRNPQNGEPLTIKAHKKIKFKPYGIFKESLS